MSQEKKGKYSPYAVVKIAYNGTIAFSIYVSIHVVSAQEETRRIEDSNVNSGYL